MAFVPVEDLEIYRLAEAVADAVWDVVTGWDSFARDTVGKQLVRAADSIGANIAEGGGGGDGDMENRRYLRYARRSLRETRFFLRRPHGRGLISPSDTERLRPMIEKLGPKLSAYIKAVSDRCR